MHDRGSTMSGWQCYDGARESARERAWGQTSEQQFAMPFIDLDLDVGYLLRAHKQSAPQATPRSCSAAAPANPGSVTKGGTAARWCRRGEGAC